MYKVVRTFLQALALLVMCKVVGAQLYLPMGSLLEKLAPVPPASCKSMPKNKLQLNKVEEIKLSLGPQWTTHVRMVITGNNFLALSIEGTAFAGDVVVGLSAKLTGSKRAFSRVCRTVAVRADGDKKVLLAQAHLRGPGILWRLDVRTRRQTHSNSALISISASKSDDAAILPAKASKSDLIRGLLCLEDIPEVTFRRPVSHSFGGRVRLDIDLAPAQSKFSEQERRGLSDLLLDAVSLWVQACVACRHEHLAVVRIDDQALIREAVESWARANLWTAEEKPLLAVSSVEEMHLKAALKPVQVLVAGDQVMPTGKELGSYVPVQPWLTEALCVLRIDGALFPVTKTVQQAVCNDSALSRDAIAKIIIRFRSGSTACGEDANVIACRADHQLTEYNVRDYRFVSAYSFMPPIGRGDVDVDLLHAIVHEMGHWIGLGHIGGGESVMASSMEQSRCIDMATVSVLARMDATVASAAKFSVAPFTMRRVGRRKETPSLKSHEATHPGL